MICFYQTADDILVAYCSKTFSAHDVKFLEERLESTRFDVFSRLVIHLDDFHGFEDASTAVANAKLESRFRNVFSKVACVGDKNWEGWATRLAAPLTNAGLKYFDHFSDALAWMRDGDRLYVHIDKTRGVVLVEPHAPLSREDFVTIQGKVDHYLKDHDKLSGLVIHTRDFPGWASSSGFVSHLSFIKDMHSNIQRVAIASDSILASLAESLSKHLVSAEVKSFEYGELDSALAWVAESPVH